MDLESQVRLRCLYSKEEFYALKIIYPDWRNRINNIPKFDNRSRTAKPNSIQTAKRNHEVPNGNSVVKKKFASAVTVKNTKEDEYLRDYVITLTGSINDVSLGLLNLLIMVNNPKVTRIIDSVEKPFLKRLLIRADPTFFNNVNDIKKLSFIRMLVSNTNLSKVLGSEGHRIADLRDKYDLRMKASKYKLSQSTDRVFEIEGLAQNIIEALVEINNIILREKTTNSEQVSQVEYEPTPIKPNKKKKRCKKKTKKPNGDSIQGKSSTQEGVDRSESNLSEKKRDNSNQNKNDTGSDSASMSKTIISPKEAHDQNNTPELQTSNHSKRAVSNEQTQEHNTLQKVSSQRSLNSNHSRKTSDSSTASKTLLLHTSGTDTIISSDQQMFVDIILIPEGYVGRLVGKGGSRLANLRKFTRTKILIDERGSKDESKYRKFTITSSDEKNVQRAKALLQANLVEEQRRDREKLENKIKKHLLNENNEEHL